MIMRVCCRVFGVVVVGGSWIDKDVVVDCSCGPLSFVVVIQARCLCNRL